MSGPLPHSPSQIIRQLLIDEGLASDGGTWPAYAIQEPDKPDNCITIYDTAGMNQGRFSVDGEVQETYGIQIRVRSNDSQTSFVKARAIAIDLETVHLDIVSVTDPTGYGTASMNYVIYNLSRRSGPLPLNDPDSDRKSWTINLLATLVELT
jgi:hypothetical protein